MKIGLTYTDSEEKHQNYIRWLTGNDDIRIVKLSPGNSMDMKSYDGLVLSGGTDIHPIYYKSKKIVYPNAPSAFDKKRDEYEAALFQSAQQNNIPVLGICRGLQLINCLFGGILKQDLGNALNSIHKAQVENNIQKDKAHGISIDKDTLLSDVCGFQRLVVNSAHHQAIKEIGNGLKINCYADDGTIEGIELSHPSGKPFLLAVQWHPERMFKFDMANSPVSKAIRDHFVMAIKKSMKDKK